MIKISLFKSNDIINKIIIKGHAGYDVIGKDIVCSAVSSIVITTINGLISIDDKTIKYVQSDNSLQIDVLKQDIITNKLIDNMIDLLIEISKKYPKNIIIKEGVSNE